MIRELSVKLRVPKTADVAYGGVGVSVKADPSIPPDRFAIEHPDGRRDYFTFDGKPAPPYPTVRDALIAHLEGKWSKETSFEDDADAILAAFDVRLRP